MRPVRVSAVGRGHRDGTPMVPDDVQRDAPILGGDVIRNKEGSCDVAGQHSSPLLLCWLSAESSRSPLLTIPDPLFVIL